MAYHSPQTSDSGSPSPPADSRSTSRHVSPASRRTSMARAPIADSDSSSRNTSTRGTPNRVPVDLPRTQSVGKGGCWTCRLRRKKCDEQREGDSCRTCIRLTIDCLGWGPKRPDWMRDKAAVEQYKANIKAKLTRAGLIRGQPRAAMMNARAVETAAPSTTSHRTSSGGRQPYHRSSAPTETSGSSLGLDSDLYRFGTGLMPGVPGASNSNFLQLPAASQSEPNINTFDIGTPFFQYSPPQSITPLSSGGDPLEFDPSHFESLHQPYSDFEPRAASPLPVFPPLAGQTSMQENHVMYYFENVTKLHFLFGSSAVTNVTYSMIVQEPRGVVTNAVCALASLHCTRMRVALGLEAPNSNSDVSMTKYFHDEAYLQLMNAKHLRGGHNESDVLAALLLISFSQMAGGSTDWQPLLGIALEWLGQMGLHNDENPRRLLHSLSTAAQLVIKCTMWMDIFSSITLMKPPKFLSVYQKLLGPQNIFEFGSMGMETLTGCPDEALLGIAEVSALAHWKTTEQRKGSLRVRELVRRGDEIEQRLHQRATDPMNFREQAPLHPDLLRGVEDLGNSAPSAETLNTLASMYRESVVLYLHTVLDDANPAVPDISSSVNNIVSLLQPLQPSLLNQAVTFPICLAGCMTDDSKQRDFLKGRLHSHDECIGNLMRIRLLMESVWQRRDTTGIAIDWRETIGERGLNILMV